jgi:hypothetical protein
MSEDPWANLCIAVESREGNVYCGNCQDFIYDPELEIRRLQKGGCIPAFILRVPIAS